MERVGIISQVRMRSERLPGKVLLPAAGRPLLDYHVERLQQSGLTVILATTVEPADDELAAYAESHSLPYHRGSEADVLARYFDTAQRFDLDTIVRVTSDCPLVDGPLIAGAVARYLSEANPLAFRSNARVRTFPRGLDFEIFSMELLAEAHANAMVPFEREHVTPFMKSNPAMTGRVVFRDEVWPDGDFGHFRITLDTPEDYQVLRTLIEEYGAADLVPADLLTLLAGHPEIVAINAHVEQKTT